MKNSLSSTRQYLIGKVKFTLALLVSIYCIDLSGQCINDINDPSFFDCSDRVVTLSSGKCTANITPGLVTSDNCLNPKDTFSFATNRSTISVGHGCNMGDVSYFQIFTPANATRYTPFSVTSVDLGVFSAVNNPVVKVKVYITDGSLNPNGWTLIGSNAAVVGNTSAANVNIPVVSTSILPSETFAIEVITPTSAVFNQVAGFNNLGHAATTYYKSSACSVNSLTNITSALGAGYGLVLSVNGDSDATFISPLAPNTYAVDHDFEAGVYNLSYIAYDAAGNSASCNFTFTVNEVLNPVSSISCNDLVNISLDTLCEAIVGPEEILQGGPYDCFDDFTVVIYNLANKPIGDKLTAVQLGQTLKVTVTNQDGNSCWGLIKVEDKIPPILHCNPIYTTCIGSLKPGSNLPQMITVQAGVSALNSVIPNTKYARDYIVNVFGLGAASITDLDVMVSIDHTSPSDLQVLVTSPSGLTTKLIGGLNSACLVDDIRVSLDDASLFNNAALQAMCNISSPAYSGIFKPVTPLSVYNGQSPNGQWKITVIDSVAGNGGQVRELALVFKQTGGKISFPTYNPVTFTELGPGYYIVTGIDPCGPVNMGYTDVIEESDCSSQYSKIIERTWSATDKSGNTSPACTQKIYVYRNGLATLRFPPNYDGFELPYLSCKQWGMTVPGPDVTGRPTGDFCDNVQVFPHEDLRIEVCEKSYKILRKWKILEWCNSEVIEHTQIIKVLDDQGPELKCPKDETISTDPLTCDKDYTPAKPEILSECSDELVFTLSYYTADFTGTLPIDAVFTTSGVVNQSIPNLPVGVTYIKWRVTDECGNHSECTFKVTVRDEVPPVAVCNQFTKVSLGSAGLSSVAATTFDDISNDNCEIVKFEARKMVDKCGINLNLTFRDSVSFCCNEVGTSIMVEFRVTDKAGNRNTCMVEIKVEDKLPPYITTCPKDITLNCQADFKDLKVTGEPVYIDNCGVVSVTNTDSGGPDQCGEGTIRRTWTVKDAQGLAGSCVQIIRLIDNDPFYYNNNNPNDPQNDIIWPKDYDATTCNSNLNPENLPAQFAYPTIKDDDCSLTSSTYKDQKFTFVNGACEKILREWTVIDWCTYVENGRIGIYRHLQIIKLLNTVDPVFTTCQDVTVNVFGECKGDVELSTGATDDCTPTELLKFTYKIDLFNDGINDPGLSGSASSFRHVLPIGKHKVTWTVEDMCANRTTCEIFVTVRDGKKPTPYCLSSVTTVVMPSTGNIKIWAKDFDHGSFDNCTPHHKLKFSFTSNLKDSCKVYTCADIPDGVQMQLPVEMWVTDEAGNQDYCTVAIILQDNTGNVCDDDIGSRVVLGGRIKTENNKSLNGTKVTLMEGNTMVKELTTTSAGNFVIENVLKDRDYYLKAEKNTDVPNGVSTLDLVLIQRHILGVSKLDSPYKIIASDANNDGKITAADLVTIRKVILGMSDNFNGGQKSFRFVNSKATFNNPLIPFPFEEKIALNDVSSNMYNQDFYGIKIGDVNASLTLNLNEDTPEPRSSKSFNIEYEVVKLDGKTRLNFYSMEDADLYGFQTSFNINGSNLLKIDKARLDISELNFNANDRGLSISWNTDQETRVLSNELLFSFDVKDEPGSLEMIDLIKSESYLTTSEISSIQLTKRELFNDEALFEVYQNEPNPFSGTTTIGFKIPESGLVKLKIYDQSGKILFRDAKSFNKGMNQFVISESELRSTGVMYYEINCNQFKATKKMIGLN